MFCYIVYVNVYVRCFGYFTVYGNYGHERLPNKPRIRKVVSLQFFVVKKRLVKGALARSSHWK